MIGMQVRAQARHAVSGSNNDQPASLADTLICWRGRCKCSFGNFHSKVTSTNISICSGPWRVAGWLGNVIFDGVVTALTLFRAIRLRKSGVQVTLAETMLQDGIYYFGKQHLKP